MKKLVVHQSQRSAHFLSVNIKKMIEKEGISVHQLSKSTGLAFPTIKRIIDSEDINPTLSSLESIANYFNISIADLLGESTPNSEQSQNLIQRTHWTRVPLIKQEDVLQWPSNRSQLNVAEPLENISSNSTLSEQAFALEVIGSSMEPVIPDKSIVIVDPDAELKHQSYVIVFKEQAVLPQIKQLLIDGPDRYIRTLNLEVGNNNPFMLIDNSYKIAGVIKEVIIKT